VLVLQAEHKVNSQFTARSHMNRNSATRLLTTLLPVISTYGINVVYAGPDHFYERLKPQKSISSFVSGAGGQAVDQGLICRDRKP